MAEKEYQRLTRARPRSRFAVVSSGTSSLWLGKDHLLCIDTTGYNESYKRFYFRDIQALIIRRTDRYKWSALILGVLAIAFFLPVGLSSEVVVKYVFGAIAGFFVLLLLINLVLGPSSACQIRTAVQIEDLPSLNRLSRARKVMDRLRPLVAAAQGELRPEEISFRLQNLSNPGLSTPASPTDSSAYAIEDPNAPTRTL